MQPFSWFNFQTLMNADSLGVVVVFVLATVSTFQAPIAVHVLMAGDCWVMADLVKVCFLFDGQGSICIGNFINLPGS